MPDKKEDIIHGLIKIGQDKHINQLQKEGKIFCNTVKYFRKVEKEDENRCDSREGAFITQSGKLGLFNEGGKNIAHINKARFNQFNNSLNNLKLFCMYSLKKSHISGKPFIDKRNTNFGNKALIIDNTNEFIIRFQDKLKSLNMKNFCNYVSYYEEKSSNKNLTVFDKPEKFAYQSEFRFCIKDQNPNPLIFNIGSIEDISIIIDSKKLPNLALKRDSFTT